MSCMIDKWHDRYHGDAPDYINCPYCQDELMEAEMTSDQYRAFVGESLRANGSSLPLPVVTIDAEVERADWFESVYDPDSTQIDRLEDLD